MKYTKKLFCVTLPWAYNDMSQGDFCELVWAKDEEAAINNLAERMSLIYGVDATRKERREYANEFADLGSTYSAEDVERSLPRLLNTLLAGPTLVLSEKRSQALQDIFKILEANGVKISPGDKLQPGSKIEITSLEG